MALLARGDAFEVDFSDDQAHIVRDWTKNGGSRRRGLRRERGFRTGLAGQGIARQKAHHEDRPPPCPSSQTYSSTGFWMAHCFDEWAEIFVVLRPPSPAAGRSWNCQARRRLSGAARNDKGEPVHRGHATLPADCMRRVMPPTNGESATRVRKSAETYNNGF